MPANCLHLEQAGTALAMPRKYQISIVLMVSVLLLGFFFSIYVTVEESPPANTVVVVTAEDKLYHSIHFDYVCVAGKNAKTMTLSDAQKKGFSPDPHCRDLGYFRGNTRFLFHHLLSKVGCNMNSRWDKNGNWLW